MFAGSSVIIDQMCTASEVERSVKAISSLIDVPIANTNAALSPMILPIANKVAVNIPGKALGKTTLKVVWVLLASKARLAFR